MNKSRFLGLSILAILGTTAICLSVTRNARTNSSDARVDVGEIVNIGPASPISRDDPRSFSDRDRVRARALSGTSRSFLSNLGDRLERPGKERVIYYGTLRRADEARAMPFTLTWELPGRLRLEDHGRQQVMVFDGETVSRTQAASTAFDDELLETLIFDSAEHLFVSQMQGASTRFLGSRFQLNESSEDPSAPVYDIFEVTETNRVRPDSGDQTRKYLFNSDTRVLEQVKYSLSRNGSEVRVEVQLEGWRRTSHQLFPNRITRFENGTPVLTLAISTIVITPHVNDGLFLTAQSER